MNLRYSLGNLPIETLKMWKRVKSLEIKSIRKVHEFDKF